MTSLIQKNTDMKNIIITILFLLPLLASAQEVTFDTTYLNQVNGTYYVIQRVEFDNGEYEEKSRALGDSLSAVQFLVNTAVNESQALANAAMTVIRGGEVRARYNLLNGLFKSLAGGLDLYRQTNRNYYDTFAGEWRIRYNGANTDLTTELQNNGNARFKDAQNATWQFRIFSPYNIQLRNWDGQNWDLYSEDGKRFTDLNKVIVLRKTN